MLKVKFKIFQELLHEEQNNGRYPKVHCLMEADKFTFIMKNLERWEYYTIISYQDIYNFAENETINSDETIDMFILNYCNNTIPLESDEIDVILEDNEEIDVILEDNDEAEEYDIHKNILEPGDDLVDEADDYSSFLLNFFNNLEVKVLKSVDKIDKGYTTKSFGDFLRDLFNIVNTSSFSKKVKAFIKIDLNNGLESAENELNLDIGFTDNFDKKLAVLSSQQIDGYIINGKKWPGIKGVTKEIQADIIRIVQEGVDTNQSIPKIKQSIKAKFDTFSDWRSELIARTETTRITNQGRVLGYKESGLDGVKVWSSAMDERTSPICRRLNGQEREFDDDFIDPETMKAYDHPPSHCMCRSSIFFKPK